ncbi:MAG TPA: hypothetical protein VG710_18015, partial [Opitutus sp.]|nr:hypothetical protein [Opitutus sp.]
MATLLIWLGIAVGFGVLRQKIYFQTPMLEYADAAVNALQIENAKHGRELYGNYSRFHIHHPGPVFFYLYAGGEILFHDWLHLAPAPGNAHLFTGLLVQALFFALALTTLARSLPRMFLPLILLAAAFYFRSVDGAFTSIWPPHVLLMPFLCFLAASVSFATGRASILPLVVLCGGLLVHGHVAQPLFVGGLGAIALVLHVGQAQGSLRWSAWRAALLSARRPAIWSAALGALFL